METVSRPRQGERWTFAVTAHLCQRASAPLAAIEAGQGFDAAIFPPGIVRIVAAQSERGGLGQLRRARLSGSRQISDRGWDRRHGRRGAQQHGGGYTQRNTGLFQKSYPSLKTSPTPSNPKVSTLSSMHVMACDPTFTPILSCRGISVPTILFRVFPDELAFVSRDERNAESLRRIRQSIEGSKLNALQPAPRHRPCRARRSGRAYGSTPHWHRSPRPRHRGGDISAPPCRAHRPR